MMPFQLFRIPKTRWEECGWCEGTGEITERDEFGYRETVTCPRCEGEGEIEVEDTPHHDYD